jgi:hypothetical protein
MNLAFRSRLLVWLIYVACWTTALVVPIPGQGEWHVSGFEIDLKFLFAKTVHVSGYALLAGLAGWLRVPLRYRWLIMYVLMVHATLTEVIQDNMRSLGRTGSLYDVALDHVGIALGLILSWNWWRDPA